MMVASGPQIHPGIREIAAKMQDVKAVLERLPPQSRGRRRALRLYDEATALIAPIVVRGPSTPGAPEPTQTLGWSIGEALAAAARKVGEFFDAAKRTARELIDLPIARIQQIWREVSVQAQYIADTPGNLIREIGQNLLNAVSAGIQSVERWMPEILRFYGQVAAGLGAFGIVATALVIFFLLRK
jgi:hypothetical protein